MKRPTGIRRVLASFSETFGFGNAIGAVVLALTAVIVIFAVFLFFHSAPPDTIIITTGPEGSAFQSTADKYAKILARSHVKLKMISSQGSVENLKRLGDPSVKVDIGFVQGGLTNGVNIDNLVSLGSLAYAPLLVFYRSSTNIDFLSQLNGRRLAVGPPGSGTRSLALTLLAANGLTSNTTTFLDFDSDDATKGLLNSNVDAVFLMGDSASPQTIRTLLRSSDIQLFDCEQADGYVRRITYLNKLILPEGSIDFGKNIPAHDTLLIGPTVELIARADLNTALSDLLLEAAREVHGRAALFQKQGEFPAPVEHEFRISQDAQRYYKSGKSFLYRTLPFWLASLVNRILVVFVPMIIVVIPGIRMIPALYRWRVRMKIYRWYRALLKLEHQLLRNPSPEKRAEVLGEIDRIEEVVNTMKVPASFADAFYALRGHIDFVRTRLTPEKSAE